MKALRRRNETSGSASAASDLEQLRRAVDASEAERADAVRSHQDLRDGRDALVTAGDLDALSNHDRAVEIAARRVEVAERRCDEAERHRSDAEHEAEQARRRELYAKGTKAVSEARRVLATEYEPAARAVAEILSRVVAYQGIAAEANDALPDNVEPIDTMAEPEFNGCHYNDSKTLAVEETYFVHRETGRPAGPYDLPEYSSNAHQWERRTRVVQRPRPLFDATPHRAIAEFVNLPGLGDDYIHAAICWGRPRAGASVEFANPKMMGVSRVF